MAVVNLASPGVKVREIDLTTGNIIAGVNNVGAIAGPFQWGPVNEPVMIESENQLLKTFGKPKVSDGQNEYWVSASNFLSYGGQLMVVRCGSSTTDALTNANSAIGGGSTTNLKIYSNDDFENNHQTDTNWTFSARYPGSWANGLKVCVIDNRADQIISGINTVTSSISEFVPDVNANNILGTITPNSPVISGIDTSNISLGLEVRVDILNGDQIISTGTTVTAIGSSEVTLSSNASNFSSSPIEAELDFGVTEIVTEPYNIEVGSVITQNINKTTVIGSNVVTVTGKLRGLVTEVGQNKISVKVTDRIDVDGNSTPVSYLNPGGTTSSQNAFSFDVSRGESIFISNSNSPSEPREYLVSGLSISDWYNSQELPLENSTLLWKSIAPKPGTSQYASERSSKNDEIHIVVIDDTGAITGTSGNILEKYISLSKAFDGKISPSQSIYYRDYINQNSQYVYVGFPDDQSIDSDLVSTGENDYDYQTVGSSWGNSAQSSKYEVIGSKVYNLSGGKDYSGTNFIDGYSVSNSDVITSYEIFNSVNDYNINYIISGPSGGSTIFESQAKANALIAIAEQRKDCVVTISPNKSSIINVADSTTQTNNILEFFSALSSSSYAIFDCNYKYTVDKLNNKFIYVPCNSDVAGLLARTSNNAYPWFSPAGNVRGSLNNVIKLAYNPTQSQRDQLYSNRVNPIISSPGSGVILFGDKTGLSYASAFDRINVRMLFLTIEKTIEDAARAQLFNFNDEITRTNFINIVEPYLRDVRSKRGITDFLVVCDESNNTPDVIDSNEFIADIYVKPARSINFVGLNFVATRTGVSFSEIIGTV